MTAFAQAPRRILMTADSIGGVWTFSLDLMAALRGSGVEFALATMGKPLTPNHLPAFAFLKRLRAELPRSATPGLGSTNS